MSTNYKCRRCGDNEEQAAAKRCERSPCPMDLADAVADALDLGLATVKVVLPKNTIVFYHGAPFTLTKDAEVEARFDSLWQAKLL